MPEVVGNSSTISIWRQRLAIWRQRLAGALLFSQTLPPRPIHLKFLH